MGKQMVSAAPGVLQRLMALRKVTQSELASQIGIDVKTLRAVIRGESVKEVTMKRFALKLGLPLEHLLTDTAATEATAQTQESNPEEPDARDYVLLKPTTAVILKEFLTDSVDITWSLDLPGLDTRAKEELLQFEKLMKAWHLQLGGEWPLDSLRIQIERLETGNEIHNRIKTLLDMSIGVFSGQYLRWERKEYKDPYEDYLCAIDYNSVVITMIALRPSSMTTAKACPDRGELPPKVFRGISVPVEINGHKVWDGRSRPSFARELDEEVPF